MDEVWNSIIEIFGQGNWPIANMEKVSGFITTEWIPTTPSDIDCGFAGIASDTNHMLKFNVVVHEKSAGISVTANLFGKATRIAFDTVGRIVTCIPTRAFEAVFAKTVFGIHHQPKPPKKPLGTAPPEQTQ